jgi:uncharacterized NAD(P)/FAD-binding protein YdhS
VTEPRRIAIVGGGFSGAAAAILLSRRSARPLQLYVVEPRDVLGAGVAHSSTEPDHRLNGTDSIHSPYPEAPGHFAAWMRDSGALSADPAAVAPSGLVFPRRRDFGRYMAAEIERHARANPSGSTIEHVRLPAVRIAPTDAGVALTLGDGSRLDATCCLLALGWNAVSVPRELAGLAAHHGWYGDPWDVDRLGRIPSDAPVLIVGAGLTASDTFAALAARGHRGPVTAISRRGLRPGSQNPYRSTGAIWDRLLDPDPGFVRRNGRPSDVREAIRSLRREIAAVDPARSSWHTPFDELRDAAWLFWPDWTEASKRQYQRHAKAWYDAFRFRNPPQVERIVDDAQRSGRLSFVGGRVVSSRVEGDALRIDLLTRRGGAVRSLRAAAAINCTGPQLRPSASTNPLWRALIDDGLARDAPSGLGVDVDHAGRLLDRQGRAQPALRAVGPPTAGRFGEVTAVPHIVRQLLGVCRQMGIDGDWAVPSPAVAGGS